MDIMKRTLMILALSTLFCIPANASITAERATNPDYLINSGYSEATAEEVFIEKNRKLGRPVEQMYNKGDDSGVLNFFRNIYGYIDPSIDTEERYHHDIHQSPSWRDL